MAEKHKVFVSYYHKDDQKYKESFEEMFGDMFILKSVNEGDIDSDNNDEYIKQLIRKDFISDASVLIVLVGPNTLKRKHVDWEIYAALDKKAKGYSGLISLHLPNHPDYKNDKYNTGNIPKRLADNLKSGYAKIRDWTESRDAINKMVETAFQDRVDESDKIDNSSPQMKQNTGE